MRISDWSSDVCSSDLNETRQLERVGMPLAGPLNSRTRGYSRLAGRLQVPGQLGRLRRNRGIPPKTMFARPEDADRKSVASGIRVSVRVDLGGSRILTKKKNILTSQYDSTKKKK